VEVAEKDLVAEVVERKWPGGLPFYLARVQQVLNL
jgi:hypothetical protein